MAATPRATRIVHFADLHLDASFAWAGAASAVARQRRQSLRDVLVRIVALTREVEADALFCGGDLYEHDRVTRDTAEFLRATFQSLDPVPVYIAPGNHDWYGPESVYARNDWSPNVHIFRGPQLAPVPLRSGLTLWGGAHLAPANTDDFLAGFRADGPGAHIALFHGAERSWFAAQGEGKEPHAAFDAEAIEAAGLSHAFLGHYHRPRDAERHTYPGNPDPLEFGEDGLRGVVIARVAADGSVARERRVVAQTEVHDLVLDVGGCCSSQEIRDRLVGLAGERSGIARLTVGGELQPDVDLREDDLRHVLAGTFDAVQVRLGDLRSGYDLAAIREEHTVRGAFVSDVLDSDLAEDEQRRVLIAGLRALDGRDDLDVL